MRTGLYHVSAIRVFQYVGNTVIGWGKAGGGVLTRDKPRVASGQHEYHASFTLATKNTSQYSLFVSVCFV